MIVPSKKLIMRHQQPFFAYREAIYAASLTGSSRFTPPRNSAPILPSTTSTPISRRNCPSRATSYLRLNHAHPGTTKRQSPQRPKIHRAHLARRQSRLLPKRPQIRHRRLVPHHPRRRPSRTRSPHRPIPPPLPARRPHPALARRHPHLHRVDPAPPPPHRSPALELSRRM